MPLEDLDLEFEDEDEQKKKRSDAMHVDVDLEFGAHGERPAAPVTVAPKPESTPAKAMGVASRPAPQSSAPTSGATVKKIDEARASQARRTGASPVASAPQSQGSSALQLAPDSDFASLAEELEETKFMARVQVAVAEHKGELLADVLSDIKLLDHQVHQLLVRINQKHPELKPEVMAIKKLLADFAAKKRK